MAAFLHFLIVSVAAAVQLWAMEAAGYIQMLEPLRLKPLRARSSTVITPEAEEDRVLQLPGIGSVKGFDLFSGWVRGTGGMIRSRFEVMYASSFACC